MRGKIGLQLKAQKRKAVFSEFFKLADLTSSLSWHKTILAEQRRPGAAAEGNPSSTSLAVCCQSGVCVSVKESPSFP